MIGTDATLTVQGTTIIPAIGAVLKNEPSLCYRATYSYAIVAVMVLCVYKVQGYQQLQVLEISEEKAVNGLSETGQKNMVFTCCLFLISIICLTKHKDDADVSNLQNLNGHYYLDC